MLTALKDLGEILLKKKQKSPVDILIENPDSNGTYKIVWALEFDKDLHFQNIGVEEFKAESPHLYLYKRASGSNAPDFSPTSRVTEPQKTFTKKVLKWFENHKEVPGIEKIYNELLKNQDAILKRLDELYKQTKENKILTIKIDGKYLYEIEEPSFKKILLEDYLSKIKEIDKKNGVCSVCGEKKEEVFTTSLIYKFYTLDKECYITGGFNKKEAWKNFPICEDCFLKIDLAKKYVEEHLRFSFYGKTYYLIPKMILNVPQALEEINEILSSEEKIQKLTNEQRNTITGDKEEILSILKDYKDVVSFYFLFLKKDNAAERILLFIEDVFPSRIHTIFDTKAKVDRVFQENYTFGKLNTFLKDFDRLFFEIIDKIFRGGRVDSSTLLQIFNKKIQDEFLNGKKFQETTTDALMNIKFFEELGLLHSEEKKMEDTKFDRVYEKVGKSLNTPAKKGVFLLGALTQMLLNIQGHERGSAPFIKSLKGLKMNEDDIKGLLAKVMNKLMEYDRFDKGKQELAQEIAKNFLSQEKFGLTVDEINFYFAAGMALYRDIANILYEEKDEKSETL
ncbi:CRISPR-associated protein Csh1 [Nitratiruptor sp. YY08-26]|uniref:TIGR02556 family CRISPR-associated protein n=1 Tax=unclassified Nitratiruptor TaxID=2624044 RepID=UPI0019157631|nr:MULTISPECIES: TIGR02556 family CRISPR-associated protein [unclassified Nitratiruptor]BCD61380.1 CRISPR-associated protein Csh1 [Nitratiruptor sp. YY08-13]BCD65314.1 CRISPR-associated protein Csh1 [Nitratiruptor sp. YY08-26]